LQDFLNIQYRNIKRNEQIRRSIESLAKSGIRAGVDNSIAETELSKARLNYIELKNQLKQLQLNVSAISGLPYQSIIPDTTVELNLINQPNAYLFNPDTAKHPLINFYRSIAPGKSTDQPMLVLQDINKLRLEVFIPEDYVDKVDLKQPVSFIFNALPGQTQTAKISRSANALSSMRSEAIEIDVINKNGNLKPGMYAEVKIPMLSGAKSLLVPNTAIVRSTEKEYVVKNDNGKADLVEIKEGLVSSDATEIFGNLKPNDKVVLKASDEIKQGDKIQ
jgi:multidrug efflux pump subunit AcrA (membrane-fusion protein)